MKKSPNSITWRGEVPVSALYNDIYYSLDGGLEECRFTFLNGTKIIDKLSHNNHTVIGETGFGTGLNFLATWQAWQKQGCNGRFTFISCEASPMTIEDLARAHTAFPELSHLSEELRASWPPPSYGFHPMHFESGTVSLLLLFGDATDTLSQLNAQVDAWYLDGFAPAKNPGMWTANLFRQIARLSKPNASLATFTAAGAVRRGLADQGFSMQKTPGYGRKRERLIGTFTRHISEASQPDGTKLWATTPYQMNSSRKPLNIAIIGAGISGAMVAYALKKRGFSPVIFKETQPINDTTSLQGAVLAPKLFHERQLEQPFFDAAFVFATNHPMYKNAFADDFGIKFLASTKEDEERLKKIADFYGWPKEWLQLNGKSLDLHKSGTLNAPSVLKNLLSDLIVTPSTVTHIERCAGGWLVHSRDSQQHTFKADTIIVAAGVGTSAILAQSKLEINLGRQHPELRPTAGQIEYLNVDKCSQLPNSTCTFGGYLTAALSTEDGDTFRTVGSSYTRLEKVPDTPLEPEEKNRMRILHGLNHATNSSFTSSDIDKSWIGLRAEVSDHLPFAGPIPDWDDLMEVCQPLKVDAKKPLSRPVALYDGLYILSGLGSKGFQYAPLLGEYLAAMIAGEPCPLPNDMIARLHPARGAVRELIRSNAKQ